MTHFCICEPVANKLCNRLAPNWLSIYLYVTTLQTYDGGFPASLMFRQCGHEFGPLQNAKMSFFDFFGFLPPKYPQGQGILHQIISREYLSAF